MSTIEKAAAKLAARQQARGSPSVAAAEGVPSRLGAIAADRASASRSVGAPPLALARTRLCTIDVDSLRERGYLVPDAPRSQLAQEMRRIKRPLLLNIQKAQAETQAQPQDQPLVDPPANLIMITSALPGEGKTFTAINLAMSVAAELNRHVLLVDADVARGDVARQLRIEPARGLSDLLQEDHHLAEDGVLSSNVEGLSVLLGGSHAEHVDELFASEMMHVVMRSLAEMDPTRVVIVDAPPLLATTEAAVLARQVGQVVLVVEANKTPQDTVAQAIAQLEGCSNVSLVLNKTTGKSASGYGYGYGYGSENTGEAGGSAYRRAEAG
ncbi:MAG: AAA family ATPase [Pseudomonadales bacterium]